MSIKIAATAQYRDLFKGMSWQKMLSSAQLKTLVGGPSRPDSNVQAIAAGRRSYHAAPACLKIQHYYVHCELESHCFPFYVSHFTFYQMQRLNKDAGYYRTRYIHILKTSASV